MYDFTVQDQINVLDSQRAFFHIFRKKTGRIPDPLVLWTALYLFDTSLPLDADLITNEDLIVFANRLAEITGRGTPYTHRYIRNMLTKNMGVTEKVFNNLCQFILYYGQNTVGGRIRMIRTMKEMSQAQAAAQCGYSQGGFSKVENGIHEPSLAQIRKIADGLGITLQAILDGIE